MVENGKVNGAYQLMVKLMAGMKEFHFIVLAKCQTLKFLSHKMLGRPIDCLAG